MKLCPSVQIELIILQNGFIFIHSSQCLYSRLNAQPGLAGAWYPGYMEAGMLDE
jgi:hypothetical protein